MKLASHLHRIGNDIVAAYLIDGPDGVTIIDAGLEANNTYDGVYAPSSSGGEWENLHPWRRSGYPTQNQMAYDFYSGGNNLIVEQNASNPNRVDCLWPGTLINQLRIFALLAQFRL